MKELKEIISSIFPLNDTSLKKIFNIIEYKNYSKEDCFIQKNKANNYEYFVFEGICRSYLIDPEGEEITISFFNPKSVLSPYVTRTIKGFSTLYFEALTDIKLGLINAAEFEQLMVDDLGIREFGNSVLRLELSKKVDKEIQMASFTAKERLLKFREEYHKLENIVPHPKIASFLGITNVSLSRLRKDLLA